MTAQKKAAEPSKSSIGMNDHNKREHEERLARDREKLKDPNLNEFQKNEIREKLAREEGKR